MGSAVNKTTNTTAKKRTNIARYLYSIRKNAFDPDFSYRRTRHGRQENSAQGIAQRVPESPFERLQGHTGSGIVNVVNIDDVRLQKFFSGLRHCVLTSGIGRVLSLRSFFVRREKVALIVDSAKARRTEYVSIRLLGVQRYHQGFVDFLGKLGAVGHRFENTLESFAVYIDPWHKAQLFSNL